MYTGSNQCKLSAFMTHDERLLLLGALLMSGCRDKTALQEEDLVVEKNNKKRKVASNYRLLELCIIITLQGFWQHNNCAAMATQCRKRDVWCCRFMFCPFQFASDPR